MDKTSYWDRFRRQRITRRRMLAATGVGAAGLVIAAACDDDDNGGGGQTTPGATVPSGTPQPGGRYKESTSVIADSTFGLDPHLSVAAGLAYFARTYNVLINRSSVDDTYVLYDLVEDGGMEHPDDTTYIFNLRTNVMIPENNLNVPSRAMDASDAVATFERIKAQPLANSCQFVCQYFSSHEATSPTVYTVTTTKPYAWFEFNIGRAISTIPPKEFLESAKLTSASVGGGPFLINDGAFTEGESVSLERNPLYYQQGRPYLDGWDVIIIPDRVGLRTSFIDEQSFQYGAASDAEVQELTGSHDVYKASDDPTYTFIGFAMNVTRKPWDDPRIRKAAMYAINRQEYVDRVYGGAAQINGIVHWAVTGALPPDELAELQPFDPEKSKQLIKEATGQDTLEITVMWPTSPIQEHDVHLPIFIEQMENAGFKIKQTPLDLGAWLTAYRAKDYDASLSLNQIYETAEIPLDFQHSKGPAGSSIYATGLQDPEIDAIIDATKSITDFDKRVAAIQDAQRKIYEKGPAFLPFVTPFSRTLYWNYVKDVPTGLGSTGLFLTQKMWVDQSAQG
jgi:peptide/nickel transport system substrate-binding protein